MWEILFRKWEEKESEERRSEDAESENSRRARRGERKGLQNLSINELK